MHIVIGAEYARLIQPFVSREATRYYLGGFYVEPHPKEGVYIVATDGHKLGVFHDADGSCDQPGIVRLERWILALLKPERKKGALARFLEVDVKAKHARVHQGDPRHSSIFVASQGDCLIDGTFPNWRGVVPKFPKKIGTPNFNFAVLASVSQIRAQSAKGTTQFRLVGPDDASPALVFTDRTDFFAVVMPMRSNVPSSELDLPGWFERPEPAAPEKEAASA